MNIKKNWINFLYNTSRRTSKVRNLLTPIGVFIFGIFTCLFVLAAIYVDNKLNLPTLNLVVWNQIISALLLILGIYPLKFLALAGMICSAFISCLGHNRDACADV